VAVLLSDQHEPIQVWSVSRDEAVSASRAFLHTICRAPHVRAPEAAKAFAFAASFGAGPPQAAGIVDIHGGEGFITLALVGNARGAAAEVLSNLIASAREAGCNRFVTLAECGATDPFELFAATGLETVSSLQVGGCAEVVLAQRPLVANS
jgi:hypothetical protein